MKAEKTQTLPCGCVNFVDREETQRMCPEHHKEWSDIHARWTQEYRAANPLEDIEL